MTGRRVYLYAAAWSTQVVKKEAEPMYLLAAAFFVAAMYSLVDGDVSNGRYALGIGVVLAGARYFLGPLQEEPLLGRIGGGGKILVVIAIVLYAINAIFE